MSNCWRVRINGVAVLGVHEDGWRWRVYRDDMLMLEHDWQGDEKAFAEWGKIQDPTTSPVEVELGPNECYARMSRARYWPLAERTQYAAAARESLRLTRNLEGRLREIFDTIEPVQKHGSVYGHELRMLLQLACAEVEASCKAILKAHDARAENMRDYARLAPIMHLGEWRVRLAGHPDYGVIAPFEAWHLDPTSGVLPWYRDHHQVKHSREENFHFATLANTIEAVAAASVLRLAQFGRSWDEYFGRARASEEFLVEHEPTWSDVERYVAPDSPPLPNTPFGLFGPPTVRQHPALKPAHPTPP